MRLDCKNHLQARLRCRTLPAEDVRLTLTMDPNNLSIANIDGAEVSVAPPIIRLFGSDYRGANVVVEFKYHAVKFTDVDCVRHKPDTGGAIITVPNSDWLSELRAALFNNDRFADFLQISKHFVIVTDEQMIEIISHHWRLEVDK